MFLFHDASKAKFQPLPKPHLVNLHSPSKPAKSPPLEVLTAAAECFMEKGYASTSLDDVARHMGATKGRIYHYFRSKSELLHHVRKHAMALNFAAIRPGYESRLPPVERFRAMAESHAMNMMKEQAYQKALFDSLHLHITRGKGETQDSLMEEFISERRQFEDKFRAVLIDGKQRGDFTFRTLSYALHTVLTTLNSTLYWYSPRDEETETERAEIAKELTEMALKALGARETPTEGN